MAKYHDSWSMSYDSCSISYEEVDPSCPTHTEGPANLELPTILQGLAVGVEEIGQEPELNETKRWSDILEELQGCQRRQIQAPEIRNIQSEGPTRLTNNKLMQDAITERLTRFLVTSDNNRGVISGPIIVSPSIPYSTLLNYYKYATEFLVGPDFFDDLLPQGGKSTEHKRLEEFLKMVDCPVPFSASDLMPGAYYIGANSWGRFLAPLNWLCQTVDELGLHDWLTKIHEDNVGKQSFEEGLAMEEKRLVEENAELEKKLKILEVKSQQIDLKGAKDELENLQKIVEAQNSDKIKMEELYDQAQNVRETLATKIDGLNKNADDYEDRIRVLEVMQKALEKHKSKKPSGSGK